MTHTCDAARVIIALGDEPHCSFDVVAVWHGMSTPAYACGHHSRGIRLLDVFRGHRARMGERVVLRTLEENAPDTFTAIPTGE